MMQTDIGSDEKAQGAQAVGQAATAPAVPFYEEATIQRLVWPVSTEEFLARYWEKRPLIVHRANPDYYGDLFTLQDFDASLKNNRGYVKTAEATSKSQAMHNGAGPSAMEAVLKDMHSGHTLILDTMHEHNSKLGSFCRLLAQDTGDRFQTNLYLTPPNGKGFRPHWDNHDVYILQVLGSKHWKIEKERRTLPQPDARMPEEGRELRGELHEFTLQQGDMVYIPRGFIHAAECGSDCSLHITLGLNYNSWNQLLMAAIKAAVLRDDSLRLSLPAGYMKGDGAGILKRVSEVLHSAADPAFLAEVLEQFRDEIVQKHYLEISGQVESFFQPKELKLDDKFGARPGLFYTIRKGEESVILKVGTRSVTFPDFFGEALEFALQTPSYAIRDLPGDLEDDLKLVFIERLMQEALLIRK